jgi:hypothetical protein
MTLLRHIDALPLRATATEAVPSIELFPLQLKVIDISALAALGVENSKWILAYCSHVAAWV